MIARGHPGDARLEGIEQRRFPLPLRLLDAHVEGRAHHEPLELRLHDPVGAARTRQAQLVATLRAHAFPARFISSPSRTVGIITGEYKVRGGRQPPPSTTTVSCVGARAAGYPAFRDGAVPHLDHVLKPHGVDARAVLQRQLHEDGSVRPDRMRVGEHILGYGDGRGWVCQNLQMGENAWKEKSEGRLAKALSSPSAIGSSPSKRHRLARRQRVTAGSGYPKWRLAKARREPDFR